MNATTTTTWTPTTPLGEAVYLAGFCYDPAQDIIYSRMDALQRQFGYAYGYDAAAPAMSALIDCEPIFFDYDGKHWMIELWKGQYGLETGCEIGVYTRAIGSSNIAYTLFDNTVGGPRYQDPAPSHNLFYDCASDDDLLVMQLTLYREGEALFSRGPEAHWWLTGFKWGVLSDASQLSVALSITLKDDVMLQAFLAAIDGRPYEDVTVTGTTVSFTFVTTSTPQPPISATVRAAVAAANQAIVSAYDAGNYPSNDPNQVAASFPQYIGLGLLHLGDLFGRVVSQLATDNGASVASIVSALTSVFGVAAQTVEEWLSGVAQDFGAWVSDIESYLGLPLDFSCYVEIDNTNGASDLLLQASQASQGTFVVPAPAWIPRGQVGRFVLQDPKPSIHGSEGSVEYSYCDSALAQHTATFAFECPTGLDRNSASVDQSGWTLLAKSTNANGSWHSSVPSWGHPLYVDYEHQS